MVDSVTLGLAIGATLVNGILAATTTYGDSIDDEALLGLVAETTSLVGTRRSRCSVHFGQLAVLPDPDTQQVAHHIALLLAVQLLNVAIGSHDECG